MTHNSDVTLVPCYISCCTSVGGAVSRACKRLLVKLNFDSTLYCSLAAEDTTTRR